MEKMMFEGPRYSNDIKFWSSDLSEWNFGDALTLVLLDELFYDFSAGDVDIRLVGSTIADGLVSVNGPIERDGFSRWRANESTKIVYWGCGVREPGSLSEAARSVADIRAVRGPRSASDLNLGAATPMGEPGLLLPALYTPRENARFVGRTVCIPHYNDKRSDQFFLSQSGCDLVLRPNLRKEKAAILEFIDAVYSADFVLCGALHGAVTAAAYEKPFAYWSNGHLDLPFKWEDFSALLKIPCCFADDISHARDIFARDIRDAIEIPSLWPMLLRSPLLLREKGLMAVLKREIEKVGTEQKQARLDQMLQEVRAASPGFEKIRERTRDFSPDRFDALQRALEDCRGRLDGALSEAQAALAACAGAEQALRLEAESHKAAISRFEDEASVRAQELASSRSELSQTRTALQAAASAEDALQQEIERLDDAVSALTRKLGSSQEEGRSAKSTMLAASMEAAALRADLSRTHGLQEKQFERMKRKIRKSRTLGGKILRAVGLHNRWARKLYRDSKVIEQFLDEFDPSLVGVSRDGRQDRILKYLMGHTDHLADFPFLRNNEYIAMYPDVAGSGLSPLAHFVRIGRYEEKNVHPLLDTRYYLDHHPEARHLASCPALHYLQWGAQKGFDPHPLFSTNKYRERYADVRLSGRNPLLHWLDNIFCSANTLFDSAYYLQNNPEIVACGRNPLAHYIMAGWREGRDPHPMFNTNYYFRANPDVKAAGMNPLIHYVEAGYREARRASEAFDPHFYLKAYKDIAEDGVDPLAHYIESGEREGRVPRDTVATPTTAARFEASAGPIVVMIDAMFPRPDQDSGSLDQISFVRIFQSLGYEVHFISVVEFANLAPSNYTYVRNLNKLGVKCIRSNEFDFIEDYLFLYNERIRLVFASRVDFGGAQMDAARRLCPNAQLVFNTVDLHFIREERQALINDDPGLLERARGTRERELALAARADAVVVVSEVEKDLLAEIAPTAHVVVIPLIRDFSGGEIPPFEQRRDVAFVGGFSHLPNVDAVNNFLETIWPRVTALRPGVRFRVIGSNMPDEMKARDIPGVDFVGYVADLERELSQIRLTVAPLRYGAGAKGKVVSSLGHGVPCVVSTIAAEGMGLTDGREVLVSDLSESFADRIVELYDDPVLWRGLSDKGRAFIADAYSLDSGRRIVEDMMAQIDGRKAASPTHA
ncbi:glycosyltransferase involved in cell wall biosynthesis/predicted nucleic acid-binding Zn-ribbon protein [Rhodoblastus acidophilus]|uniref:glycosyltransferase n=1 Tax=Rhodoblastus acidophilus TaxID=1074 RepID=UPI0022249189|nr:glycosyltransferase [Rhodoblastus acidophilus]MCW2284515.1 glycosyltransferase involved in cell wall biosynthesis/predicted nucleic acid-binding Zn-ribbon protein [Rhodoblastus acidophilus]MCW2333469.1 glycosyltransferase involved in cell wall biosynthesis/predicted nucleic acid-binding Zn-ribbon protein [Rhodoblastus acidophilus]